MIGRCCGRGMGFILALLVLATVPVPGVTDEAKDLYEEGIKNFDAGNYKDAAETFRKAYALKASWKVFYNIGQAEAAATRYGLALEAFENYLVSGGDDVPNIRREKVIEEIQRMRVLVGVIEVDAEPGAELLVDGISRGTTPFEGVMRVAAGRHEIVVRRNGDILVEKIVKVAGGMTNTVDAKAAQDGPGDWSVDEVDQGDQSAGDEVDPGPSGVRPKLVTGIVLGAVGLGAVGMGIGFTAKGSSDNTQLQEASDAGDRAKFDTYNEKLSTDRALMITGLAVGGAFVATGVVLIVLDVVGRKKPSTSREVAIVPAPGGLSVSF